MYMDNRAAQRKQVFDWSMKIVEKAADMNPDEREEFIRYLRARAGNEDFAVEYADIIESMIRERLTGN